MKLKRSVKVDGVELTLPTEKNEPLKNLLDASFLLYGPKKIGKTTLLSQFEDPFFIFFEPGGRFISTFNRSPKTWPQFKGYLDLLEKEDKFRTVILDTVDQCYNMCYRWVCDEMGIEHPQDQKWGSAWKRIEDEFASAIMRIVAMDRGKIFTSHSEEKDVENEDGQEVRRIIPTMPKQAARVLEALVDIWACYKYKGKERVLYVEGNENISAGHRLKNNFVGVQRISMGSSDEEAYRNLKKAFHSTRNSGGSDGPKLKLKK